MYTQDYKDRIEELQSIFGKLMEWTCTEEGMNGTKSHAALFVELKAGPKRTTDKTFEQL